MSDHVLEPELARLRDEVREFVRAVVIPEERELGLHEPGPELRRRMQSAAAAAGLLAPQAPMALGGRGLTLFEQSVILEEAGYSLLGPLALNCAAPDEGNMHLLHEIGSDGQRERYLAPLVRGDARSFFAMTEPAPGAGSDPEGLSTSAARVPEGWRINGRKWLITGAEGASFGICMARTSSGGATMFMVDAENPGFSLVRRIGTLDHAMSGGHCEVDFSDCLVRDDAVLGAVDEGFRYARIRLVPARLTHCMRWLGLARRSLDVALDRTADREVFGSRLHDLGLAQALIADSVIDLETSRALIRQTCSAIDAGASGSSASSVAKVFVSEAVFRVVDRAIQLCGGVGVSHDLPLARFLTEVRAFRIYDGPSEVHRWAIARRASRERAREQT
ncbi:MAG: acyl-CoA dehydrogenase [Gaiellales bacterium]|nr:acyl-CoA dehydrogenase [Gaiellales bacterium]